MRETLILKVASSSDAKAVAGSIFNGLTQGNNVELVAIGAGAVNQSVKAIAMARGFMGTRGRDLYVAPGFTTVNFENEDRTGIRLVLKVQ